MCCEEKLLLGAILMYICLGREIARPVPIVAICPGAMVICCCVKTSKPMEPFVARVGIVARGDNFIMDTVE